MNLVGKLCDGNLGSRPEVLERHWSESTSSIRARIFKLLMSQGIGSKDATPPAHAAWQASTATLFAVPAHHTTQTGGIDYPESTPGPTKVKKFGLCIVREWLLVVMHIT